MNLTDLNKKIKDGASGAGRFLENRPFECSMALILLAFLSAGLIYYLYVLNPPLPPRQETVELRRDLYQKIMERSKNRDAIIQEGMEREYPDIFQ